MSVDNPRLIGEIWCQYLTIQKGEEVVAASLSNHAAISPTTTPTLNRAGAANLVLFNSQRLGDHQRARQAVSAKYHFQQKGNRTRRSLLFDVALQSAWAPSHTLRGAIKQWVMTHPIAFIRGVAQYRSVGGGLIQTMRQYIRKNDIGALELFTSNNRLTECLRIAAIAEGINVTEFLHGVCSDSFARYYMLLNRLAAGTTSNLEYVNMLPGLPQPEILIQKLLKFNDTEVFFRNEKPWDAFDPSRVHDVLIVGGTAPSGNYLESQSFQTEIEAALHCHRNGLTVVYCPHPAHVEEVRTRFPEKVTIGTVAEFANSSRAIVGHYSTVLFSARIMGHQVLIFKEAWPVIPVNLAVLFSDRDASTYDPDKLVQSLLELPDEPSYGGIVIRQGYDLENSSMPSME